MFSISGLGTFRAYLPLDVFERGRREERESEIHGPIPERCKRDGFRPDVQGKDLRGVNPSDWTPGGSIGGDEEITAGDDSFRRTGLIHNPSDCGDVVDAAGHCVAVDCHQGTLGEQPHCKKKAPCHHHSAPGPFIDEHERRNCHHDVLIDVSIGMDPCRSLVSLTMMYWMEAAIKPWLPDNPAIAKMYTM